MPLNPFFNFHGQNGVNKESDLYRKMHQETIQIFGCRFLYAKRELTKMDRLFGEDLSSSFNEAKEIEGWIETFDGYQGDGDLISKFGLKAHDELRIVVSAKAFTENTGMRVPREGDLILNPLTNELFEIKFFEHQEQFYPLGAQMSYKIRCETLEPSAEKIDIPEFNEVIGGNNLQEVLENNMPNHADNVIVQTESDAITDWSENSPFGEY